MARGPFSTTDYLGADTAPSLSFPITVFARTRTTATILGTSDFLNFYHSTSGASRNMLSLGFRAGSADGALALTFGTSSLVSTLSPTTEITLNQWHCCFACIASAESRIVYLDTNASDEATATRNFGSTPNWTTIGARRRSEAVSWPVTATAVAESAVWGVVLTADERLALIDGLSPLSVRPASLRFYAPCLEQAAGAVDWVGGHNLSLTGSVAAADHPRIIYPRRRIIVPVSAAAPTTFIPSWARQNSRVIGGGV